MTSRDVTAIVVAHDAGLLLDATIEELLRHGPFAEVLVVDSGSRDGSAERVAAAHSEVRLIRYDENVGPCVTRNRGLREAKTEFVLFLDDDIRLAPGTLQRLRDELDADPSLAMVGPRTCYADRPDIIQYEGAYAHFAGLPHFRHLGEAAPVTEPAFVDVVSSGCLLARRVAMRDAGGFDESYFYLIEDVEFSLRLRLIGWRLKVVPEALAWNAGGSSGLSLRGQTYPARRIYYHARNRALLVLGLYRIETLVVLAWPLLFFDLAWFLFACLGRQPVAFLRGRWDVLRCLPAIRAARARVAGRRRVRDGALLGAPSLTFTPSALAQPLARQFARVLDGVMKLFFAVVRGALP